MKIYTPDGRPAVLKNNFLHIAPDADSEKAVSIKIVEGLILKKEGPVPKHLVYELSRSNAAINLSKSGDSTSALQKVSLSGSNDLPKGGLELFMDEAAIASIRKIATPVKELDGVESTIDLAKPKSQQKAPKSNVSESPSLPRRKLRRSSGADSDVTEFRRALVFIISGVLMLSMPEVFMAIFERASGAQPGSGVGPDGAVTLGVFAKELEQGLESMMAGLSMISTLFGISCMTLGVFKLYKAMTLR